MAKTTYDVFVGICVMLTSNMARNPSTAFIPSTPTLKLWLMPKLVFSRRPERYKMSVLYVYPSDEVVPEYVVPFVRLRVGTGD